MRQSATSAIKRFVVRQVHSTRSWWSFELPLNLAFAISLPLMAFTKQLQPYNYLIEVWLPLGLFALMAVVLSMLFHFSLPAGAPRLAASISAFYWLMVQYPDRIKASSGNALLAFIPGKGPLVTIITLLSGSYALGWAVVWLGRRWHPAAQFARTLLASFCLVMLTYHSLGLGLFIGRQAAVMAYTPPVVPLVKVQAPAVSRDVYYIVLDRYASQTVLRQDFGFDNSAFYQNLTDQGFTVTPDAFANYPFTAMSLASTLNMDYLADVSAKLKDQTTYSQLPYRRLFEVNQVAQTFMAAGYHTYNISSWFGVARTMAGATNLTQDQFNFNLAGDHQDLSDYQQAVLGQTVYTTLLNGGRQIGSITVGQMLPTRSPVDTFNRQINTVLQAASDHTPGPKFVFTHLISPHPPYIFTNDGQPVSYNDEDNDQGIPREQKYLNQLQYLNQRILQMVEQIKSASQVPPVIVIAADEGPYPRQFAEVAPEAGGDYKWEQADASVIRHKAGIFQAAFLPEASAEVTARLTTPVNTFRLIFNQYFDAGLPYLPDCSFISDNDAPYRFIDLTPALASTPDPACAQMRGPTP
jgi:hypothetical protein